MAPRTLSGPDTADVHEPEVRSGGVDSVIAALAGPLAWETDLRERSFTERAAVTASAVSLGGQIVTVIAVTWWNPNGNPVDRLVLASSCCLAGLLVPSVQVWLLATHRRVVASTSMFVLVRTAGMLLAAIGWAGIAEGPAVLLTWPIGVHLGIDYAITAMHIDRPHPISHLLIRMVVSPLHAGLIAGLVTVAALGGSRAVGVAVDVAMSIVVVVLAGVTSYGAVNRVGLYEAERIEQVRSDERAGERRRRAHWIHDDVCADLRTVRIMLATQSPTTQELTRELDDLDHRLRLRQLEEIVAGGSVSAAEIIQPYLRRAQNSGVRLVEVPRYEDASIIVPSPAVDTFRRAVAGLVGNAVAAGAHELSIRLRHREDWISVVVEDDAGGFDLPDVPAGRGLSSLARDVGHDNLDVCRGSAGAIVTVSIPLRASS